MTSNWQLHGQLARTARGTERRGAVAVLLARPAAGCTPRCVAGGFAQTAPSLVSGRAETGGGWPPTAAIAPWPHPGASHLQRAALGSSQRCLPPLQTAFANPTPPPPVTPRRGSLGCGRRAPLPASASSAPQPQPCGTHAPPHEPSDFIEHILI